MNQQIVAKQANLDLMLKGTPDTPLLTIVLRNTGDVPITVDSELVFGVTIELWGLRDEQITPQHTPLPKEENPAVQDVRKRLTALPPGGAISRLVALRRGWKVLGAAIGTSREGGPLLGGYEQRAQLPERTRVRKIIVTYGDYGDFWKAFVGFARLSPAQAGLFLGPIQQSVEIVGAADDDQSGGPANRRNRQDGERTGGAPGLSNLSSSAEKAAGRSSGDENG